MSITTADLKIYKSLVINNTSSNGSYMSTTQLDSVNTMNNLFDNVLKDERLAGSTVYRKVFCKNENVAFGKLYSGVAWIDNPTAATGDYITIFPGIASDTQGTISPTRVYGVAYINTNVTAASSTILATVEDSSLLVGGAWPIFQVGDKIRLTDKANPAAATSGNEEWLTISNVTNTTGLGVSINTTLPITNGYLVSNSAKVSSLAPLGDLQANVTGWTVTSASGTCNSGSLVLDNVGCIEDTITVTILAGATTFSVVSTRNGALSNGSLATNYIAANPNFSGYNYFTINSTAWGGTFLAGDTVVFSTHPSACAIWQKRIVVAGASPQSNNSTIIAFNGQSL